MTSLDTAMAGGLIVIPARYGSTRLPGKPLLKIAGMTLLERVVANARRAADLVEDCSVLVATDDKRIEEHAKSLGVAVVMTDTDLDSGTSRAHAATLALRHLPKHIVNLQGDAPFIPPSIIVALLNALRTTSSQVVTPVYQLDWERLDRLREHKKLAPFSGTTCIRGASGRALWFSKNIIPAIRDETHLRAQAMSPIWQHMGLYAYTIEALEWFTSAMPSTAETLEGLEQLRFLENGWTVGTIEVDAPTHAMSGIDTKHDLALAEQAILQLGEPLAD